MNYQILNKESIVQSKSEQDLAQRVLKQGALNELLSPKQ